MKRLWLASLLVASFAFCKTFTLEQVLSAPFPSELVAAPGGGKVAWLLNERGARNIWIAALGEIPRKIAVGHSPAISPKGDRVAYLLGGQIWSAPLSGTGAPHH